jgi:hypothetical protein
VFLPPADFVAVVFVAVAAGFPVFVAVGLVVFVAVALGVGVLVAVAVGGLAAISYAPMSQGATRDAPRCSVAGQ